MAAAHKANNRHGSLPDETDDLSHHHLEKMKAGYYETKVVIAPETINFIERQTIDQADNELWKKTKKNKKVELQ